MLNPSRFLLMRGEHSALSSPRRQISSSQQQPSTTPPPHLCNHLSLCLYSNQFKITHYPFCTQHQKQQLLCRSKLQLQYIPQFEIMGQEGNSVAVKIKQYPLEGLPWLMKKDSLFRISSILGIYIACLQLVEVYGVFVLKGEMVRVNQKEQLAIWFSPDFQLLHPPQTPTTITIFQFLLSFITIFKCCLPTRWISQTSYTNQNQLLVELTKLERKQRMHKNCHQFIKHELAKKTERNVGNKRERNGGTESRRGILVGGQQGKVPSFIQRKNQLSLTIVNTNNDEGLRSEREIKKVHFEQKIGAKRKKKRCKSCFEGYSMQKKTSIGSQAQQQSDMRMNKQLSICSTGNLFKRYLLYTTLKNRKVSKLPIFNNSLPEPQTLFPDKPTRPIFIRQQNYRAKGQAISGGNSPLIMSQKLILSTENEKFSPIKFRKFSSSNNPSEKISEQQVTNKRHKKPGWHHKRIKSEDMSLLTCKQHNKDITRRPQQKQKLQNSYPLQTASTLTSFRLSNQHQQLIASNKQQQPLPATSPPSLTQPIQRQKDDKIQQMKIQEQTELQAQLNNIFSMENSKVKHDQHQREMERIIMEFEEVLL